MSGFFLVIGSFAVVYAIVWIILAFMGARDKKKAMMLLAIGFVFMIFGAFSMEPEQQAEEIEEETEVVDVEQTTQERLAAMLETNTEFKDFADLYFSMTQQEQDEFFEDAMNGANVVNWGGVVLQSQANNIMVYGGDPSLYNDEDWITLMSERPELIHYVINVAVPSKSQVAEVQKGDEIIVNGGIMRAGNAEEPMVWMLEDSLIVDKK